MGLPRRQPNRYLLAGLIGLVSLHTVGEPLLYLQTAEQPGSDLPPAGTRSVFDYLVEAGAEGVIQKEIYPYSKLQRILADTITGGGGKDAGRALIQGNLPLLGVLIPFSRSLQRQFSSYEMPRALLAVAAQPKQSAKSFGYYLTDRIFIGYAKAAKALEVISYNEHAGRTEFQMVVDYDAPPAKPKVLYASRALCLTCHKNLEAMFPQGPWSETNANPEIVKRILAKQPVDHQEFYEGIAIRPGIQVTDDGARSFDRSTDAANFFAPLQEGWRKWCGDNDAAGFSCRAVLLRFVIENAIRSDYDPTDPMFVALDASFRKVWKDKKISGFRLANFDLRNRDPFSLRNSEPTPAGNVATTLNTRDLDAKKLEELLEKVRLPPQVEPANPLSHVEPPLGTENEYTMVWDNVDQHPFQLIYDLRKFFTDADIAWLKELGAGESERLARVVKALAVEKNEAISNLPFRRTRILTALAKKLSPGLALPVDPVEEVQGRLGAPALAADGKAVHDLPFGNDPRVAPFVTYCSECHIPMQFPIDFAKAKDDEEVLSILAQPRVAKKIHLMLDWKNNPPPPGPMPRTGSDQKRLMEEEEKAAAKAGRKSLRQQMLDLMESFIQKASE